MSVAPTESDLFSRKKFWSSQLDEAALFMDRIMDYPVCECGEPVVDLREAVSDAEVQVTFSTTLIANQLDRIFVLREGLMKSFLAVAREMNRRGWVLRVEDGFRTREMQRCLSLAPYVLDLVLGKVIWELDGQTPDSSFFYRRLMVLTATAPKIGTHMSGSAIDISVHAMENDCEIDRGAPYIEMSEKTPMASPFVSPQAARNREAITELLAGAGFVAYPYEFWHYSQGDAYDEMMSETNVPARYGAVDVDTATGCVSAIENPTHSLHVPEDFERAMTEALQRIQC